MVHLAIVLKFFSSTNPPGHPGRRALAATGRDGWVYCSSLHTSWGQVVTNSRPGQSMYIYH